MPDLPTETEAFFDQVFSPDAQDFPGLSLEDWTDYGGLDPESSAGEGGGIGGGTGTGQGEGSDWGVGPGEGGGFGGGKYSRGGWDIDPTLVYEPPAPAYPPRARSRLQEGEVLLEIVIRIDGSTDVVKVWKSIPDLVETAIQHARLYKWKPALKKGKPIEAIYMLTVTFELYAGKKG